MENVNKLWAQLLKIAPKETEEIIQDELDILRRRVQLLEAIFVDINHKIAIELAEKMRDDFHRSFREPLTDEEEETLESFTPKGKCTHAKGGSMRQLAPNSEHFAWDKYKGPGFASFKDYNVSDHIFPDGSRVIKCLTCGMKWRKGDADWNTALKMSEQSTNTRTASQVVIPEKDRS